MLLYLQERLTATGNDIRYSFADDFEFNIINGVITNQNSHPILYNGTFKKYSFEDQASGEKFEKFTMSGIGPNDSSHTIIDNDTLHVFVENINEAGIREFKEVPIVKNLILDASYDVTACEIRLNEDKEFEVKFGDGIHGKMLPKGTNVHIIYLVSNGAEGVIDSGEMTADTIDLNIIGFTSKNDMIDMVYGGRDMFCINYAILFTNNYVPLYSNSSLRISNIESSSEVLDYEDVEDIKEYAPFGFRLGNRLVTAKDYETYIMNTFKNRFKSVYVLNNSEYCSVFYKWLDFYGKLDISIKLNNYKYSSACDFNNIYVFLQPLKTNVLNSDREAIVKACANMKSITTDIIPCDGIHVYFMPYVKSDNFALTNDIFNANQSPAYIFIKKGSTYFSDASIKKNVANIISNYFDEHCKLGSTINLIDIQQQIMALGYIDDLKTVSTVDIKNGVYTNYVNGLSFGKFTQDLINMADFTNFTQMCELEKFQYGTLLNKESLIGLIKITNENIFSVKTNEF